MGSDEIDTMDTCVITAPELASFQGASSWGVAVPWVETQG